MFTIKLQELEVASKVTLQISNEDNQIYMDAIIKKQVKENIAIIELVTDMQRRLIFDTVRVNIEYEPEDGVPYIWRDVQIVNVRGEYILKVRGEGVRHNRRSSFRVPVACQAYMRRVGKTGGKVMIRDVSLSGFSITDRNGDYADIDMGEVIEVEFEDIGHYLKLRGKAVRSEELENGTIYGFEIVNLCKDLSSYVNVRQRRKDR